MNASETGEEQEESVLIPDTLGQLPTSKSAAEVQLWTSSPGRRKQEFASLCASPASSNVVPDVDVARLKPCVSPARRLDVGLAARQARRLESSEAEGWRLAAQE